MKNDVVKY